MENAGEREWSQPRWLGEGATAENTEGGRHNTAGMKRKERESFQRNEMERKANE